MMARTTETENSSGGGNIMVQQAPNKTSGSYIGANMTAAMAN